MLFAGRTPLPFAWAVVEQMIEPRTVTKLVLLDELDTNSFLDGSLGLVFNVGMVTRMVWVMLNVFRLFNGVVLGISINILRRLARSGEQFGAQ
jgi:hypothetical protein